MEVGGALRRWWKVRRFVTRLALVWLVVLLLIVLPAFLLTVRNVGTGAALDITTGAGSPFDKHAGAAGVALAVLGYLAAPAIIGTVVSAVFQSFIDTKIGEVQRRLQGGASSTSAGDR